MAIPHTPSDHDDQPSPSGSVPAGLLDAVLQPLIAQTSAFRTFLRRRVNDDALAEDLLQHSFVRAMERYHTLKESDRLVPWFYRILRHALVDYYRSQTSETKKYEAFLHELTASGEDTIPPPDEVKTAVCACLYKLLPAIRPNYAELVRRIDLEGESPDAVGRELNLTRNNLTVRLHRARQALRAELEESCGICSKHGCLNCACE